MLDQKQVNFKKEVINFAKQNLDYDIIKNDYESVFNKEAWLKCGEYGVQGWLVPKRYGGGELSVLDTVAGMQGLGYACLDDGLLFGISAHLFACVMPILSFGTEEQKERYLPPMCSGKMIASHSATEPKVGSDIYSLTTTAEKKGDKYVLNGEKHYVTNGEVADIFIVFANTNPSLKEKGISAFIIPRDTDGLITTPLIETMGNRTSGIVRLRLENCEVHESQLLGSEGMGTLIFASSMEWERGFILSRSVGAMERLLEKSLKYAKKHRQFGQPIGKFQYVSGKLVEMHMNLENAKNLIYNLAQKKDKKKTVIMDAALVNLYISEAWVKCSMNAIEIYGGNGYITENEIEREVRNAIGSKFYSGTTEMQKTVIAKFMGL
jgi:alkylation response protein AidB-like acyl-CoA dehydrogenase